MSTLYELSGYYQELSSMLDDPETDQDSFLAALSAISDEIEIKADNYAKLIRNMETSIESITIEQKRLAARKNTLEKSIAQLKDNLQEAMLIMGKRKFKTDLFSFAIQKNGGALPIIMDVDTSMLPDEYVIVTEKPNLKEIGTFLQEHPECEWAHFGERGESLRIR